MSHSRLIKIVVFADFICGYSYVGHKALTDAVRECSDLPVDFEIEYRAIRLNNSLPEDFPIDRRTYLTGKYGDKFAQVQVVVGAMCQSMGLPIVSEGQISQSTRAHRLMAKAYLLGGQKLQELLIDLYFRAYFAEGKDIGNVDLLGDLAEEAGVMTKDQAITFLKSQELVAEVENTIAHARANGIKGSPVTIIDGKFKLDGVQTKDTFIQVFKRLGKCEQALAAGSPCSETSSDGTISPGPHIKSNAIAV